MYKLQLLRESVQMKLLLMLLERVENIFGTV